MVYSMSSYGSRSGYEALVTQETAKREIVPPKFDPKMDKLAVVLRQATIMARDLILLQNHSDVESVHSVESGGRDLINDIVLLIRLATYADPTKLRLQLSKEGTVEISLNHFLSSRYSSEDLQEIGIFTSRVVGQYINLIDGSRVHISNGIADEIIARVRTMTRDKYLSTQRELREFVLNYFELGTQVNFPEDLTYHAGTSSIKQLYFIIQYRLAHAGMEANFPYFGFHDRGQLMSMAILQKRAERIIEINPFATCEKLANLSYPNGRPAPCLYKDDNVIAMQEPVPNLQDRSFSSTSMVSDQVAQMPGMREPPRNYAQVATNPEPRVVHRVTLHEALYGPPPPRVMRDTAVCVKPRFTTRIHDYMAAAGIIAEGANATASVLQASLLGQPAPGTFYSGSNPMTSADVKTEGASGDGQPPSDGKVLGQANVIFNMAGSAPSGVSYAGANLPTQGSAPTSSAPPKQPELKHGMSERNESVVYQKLPRPVWKNYKPTLLEWEKVSSVQLSKRQLVEEVEQLKAQLRAQSKRHVSRRERKMQIKQEARPIAQIKQETDPLMDHSSGSAQDMPKDRHGDEWKDENLYPPLRQSPKKRAFLAVPMDEPDLGITFAPQAYGLNYPPAQAPRVKMERDGQDREFALHALSLPTGEMVPLGDD